MKYCENCKKNVSVKLSQEQLGWVIILTCLFILPGILYFALAKKQTCVVCGNITLEEFQSSDKNLGE